MPGSGYTPGLVPGANVGGTNQPMPTPFGGNMPAIGGGQNPLLPTFPSAQSVPSPSNTMSPGFSSADAASTAGNIPGAPAPSGGLSGTNLAGSLGFGGVNGSWAPNQNDFIKAFHKAGYSAGDAALLYNFLQSGAGFNQEAINAIFAAMQPQIQRGEADILEQFSTQGLRGGSPAAIGMGDYLSQVNLNQGQIEAQMYEQSVQNYMNVLLAGKGPAPKGLFDNLMTWMNAASGNMQKAAAMGGV